MRHAYFLAFAGVMISPLRAGSIDAPTAQRLANLALACIHREYPTKISHSLNSPEDARVPRDLTPAFYGCYDWHSSVHGHWMLVRLLRLYPDSSFAPDVRSALAISFTRPNLQTEAAYVAAEGRESFERPYGLAWLLQLASELHEWDDKDAKQWATAIGPLERMTVNRLAIWLPKLAHPVRSGEHSNTAFAMGLMLDYARVNGDIQFQKLIEEKARVFYERDRNCPMSYEPSGEDFLSPCLAEADLMRRVLPQTEFSAWLRQFLPGIPRNGSIWMQPEVVTDPTDGKLAHLDGLNLSRAWMLNGIAAALPTTDDRAKSIRLTAETHAADGLASVTGEHYAGGHWLGSFAVYLLTKRGLPSS